jgi:hypothetical protein
LSDQALKNLLILLPVLAGISVASYLLYNDYHSSNVSEELAANREVIGEMLFTDKNVSRQLENEVLWDKIEKKTPIYNKDSIRTGQNSEAVVKLLDNTMIELNENSLIVLVKNQQNLSLKFKAGDIATHNAGKSLEINVDSSVIRGEGADVKIKTLNNTGKARIQVDKGKISVVDKNKKTASINQSEEAGLDSGALTEIDQIAVILKSPANHTQVTSIENSYRQAFTWEVTSPKLLNEQFEIAKANDFLPAHGLKIFKAHQAISPTLSPGIYFWRVGWTNSKSSLEKTLYTESRQLTIGADMRLELTFPENDSQFDFSTDENSIDFQWKSQIKVKAYVLEIATSSDFRKLVFSRTLNDTTQTVKELPSGYYFWRLKAFGDHNDELASSTVRNFSIHTKIKTLPELLKPEPEAVWENPEPLVFSWKSMDQASEYRITLSKDFQQKEIFKTKSSKLNSFSTPLIIPGTYYWSVRAINAKSALIGQSDVRKLNYKIKAKSQAFILTLPKEKSVLSRESTNAGLEPVLFQWQVTRKIINPVTLLVGQTSDFSDAIKHEQITSNSVSETLSKSGLYYWKLQAPPDESETGTFNLKVVNSFETPTLLLPVNQATIELDLASSTSTIVKFSWTPMPTAFQYHIVVERGDDKKSGGVTVIDRLLKEWNLTSQPLIPGQYSWTVSAIASDGSDGGQSGAFKFSIIVPPEMDAPVLNQPVVK